jgi:hypothetical protein
LALRARQLERINWLDNAANRAIQEAFGITGNYLYGHDSTEGNHEAFARDRTMVHSPDVRRTARTLSPCRALAPARQKGGERRRAIENLGRPATLCAAHAMQSDIPT